jgi:hypothetical protein
MTREEFWDEDPQLFWAFWDAYEQRKDEEAREENVKAFNQGQYFMLALGQVLQFTKNPKKIYPKKPLEMKSSKKTESKMTQQQYEEIRKIHLQERIARFNSKK